VETWVFWPGFYEFIQAFLWFISRIRSSWHPWWGAWTPNWVVGPRMILGWELCTCSIWKERRTMNSESRICHGWVFDHLSFDLLYFDYFNFDLLVSPRLHWEAIHPAPFRTNSEPRPRRTAIHASHPIKQRIQTLRRFQPKYNIRFPLLNCI
jgi:hypothetical protein